MGKQNGKPGGKKHKRGKKEANVQKELIIREDGQEYAQVLTMLGDMRVEAECLNDEGELYKKRVCKIRGAMRKRAWISKGDIILLGLRDFQDDKADVIHKYSFDDVLKLRAYKEIPETMKMTDGEIKDPNDGIIFGFSSDEEVEEITADDIDDI